jgi:hypothetical protein
VQFKRNSWLSFPLLCKISPTGGAYCLTSLGGLTSQDSSRAELEPDRRPSAASTSAFPAAALPLSIIAIRLIARSLLDFITGYLRTAQDFRNSPVTSYNLLANDTDATLNIAIPRL